MPIKVKNYIDRYKYTYMDDYYQTSDQAVIAVLQRIAAAGRKQRLTRNISQKAQAELAGISIKALQKIEAGEGGNSSVLFKYLHSLDLLKAIYASLPDPDELTPIEKLAIQERKKRRRASRESTGVTAENLEHVNAIDKKTHKWGDEN